MKKIEITLFSNRDYDFDEYKEYYKENLELTDEEMEDVSDERIWNYISDCKAIEFNALLINLKHGDYADCPCVIMGSLGLWNGRHEIYATPTNDFEEAIRKCVKDCDYIEVCQVGGHIEVSASHHDGTNHFEIHLLNNKGIDAKYRLEMFYGKANLANKCYHKAIHGYIF